MKRTMVVVMLLVLISKITGFLREVAIAGAFGATYLADVYKSSLIVPGLVVSLFTVGLNAAMIPILSSAERNNKREDFFQNFLSVITILSIAALLIIVLFTTPMTKLFVPGYSADKLAMTIKYTRVIAIIAPLQVLAYTLIAWLQQRERFYIAAFVSIPMNLIIVLGAILNKSGDLRTIAAATIIGYTAQFLWVLYPYLKTKPQINLQPTLKDPYIRMFWTMVVPVILTLAAGQINILIDVALASGLGDGIVSNMDYVNRVNGMFQSVLVLSMSSVLFTEQSKLSSSDNKREVYLITKHNLLILLMIMVPVALGTMFLSKEIMTILFVRGRYTLEAAAIGGGILFFYAPTIVTRAMMEIFGKMFFSLHMPKKTMFATVFMIIVNIILNFIFVRLWGAYGLAIATSVASIIGLVIIAYQTRVFFQEENIPLWSPSITKLAIAGVVMFLALYALDYITPLGGMSPIPKSAVSFILGAGIYAGILYWLKTEELFEIVAEVRSRLSRGRR